MIGVKEKSVIIWNSVVVSNIVQTILSQENRQGSNSNQQAENQYRNIRNKMVQNNFKLHYG